MTGTRTACRGVWPHAPTLVVLVGLTLAGSAWAASGRYLSPDDVAVRAAQVVEGIVVEARAELDPAWRRVVTRVRVVVDRTWRGQPLPQVEVLVLGGELPERDLVQWVPGEASFALGERVLLFLEPIPGRAQVRPVGMRQGVFRPAPGGAWVRDFDGLSTQAAADPAPRERPAQRLEPAQLPALLERAAFDPLADVAPRPPTPSAGSARSPYSRVVAPRDDFRE